MGFSLCCSLAGPIPSGFSRSSTLSAAAARAGSVMPDLLFHTRTASVPATVGWIDSPARIQD